MINISIFLHIQLKEIAYFVKNDTSHIRHIVFPFSCLRAKWYSCASSVVSAQISFNLINTDMFSASTMNSILWFITCLHVDSTTVSSFPYSSPGSPWGTFAKKLIPPADPHDLSSTLVSRRDLWYLIRICCSLHERGDIANSTINAASVESDLLAARLTSVRDISVVTRW